MKLDGKSMELYNCDIIYYSTTEYQRVSYHGAWSKKC